MSYLHIYMSNQQSVGIFRSVEDVTFLLRCRLNTESDLIPVKHVILFPPTRFRSVYQPCHTVHAEERIQEGPTRACFVRGL